MNKLKIKKEYTHSGSIINWFSTHDQLSGRLVILISSFLFLIFSARDLLVLFSSSWPHLYSIVDVSLIRWEEIVVYLSPANFFSFSNLSPSASAVDGSLSGMPMHSMASLLVYQLLFKTIGFGNLDFFLFLNHGLFPIINFWLIYLIFRIYIHKSWSILLAFMGVSYFSGFSSFGYVIDLLKGAGDLISSASLDPPEVTRSPFPGISLMFLSGAILLTLKNNIISSKRILFLSFVWGIQIYVYFFNYLIGVPFLLLWMGYAIYFSRKTFSRPEIIKFYLVALGIIACLSVPFILRNTVFLDLVDQQFLLNLNISDPLEGLQFSGWGFFIAYFMPIFLLLITVYILGADTYELFYKFSPIFIIMVTEIMISFLPLVFYPLINPEIYQHRIGGLLFRLFYFIPLLYFLNSPFKSIFSRNKMVFLQFVQKKLHTILSVTLIKGRLFLCVSGVVILATIEILGAFNSLRHFESNGADKMKEIERELETIKQISISSNTTVSESIATNFLIPLKLKKATLLVNSFSNHIEENEILNRLLLFSKVNGWEIEEFINFMSPSRFYTPFKHASGFTLKNEMLKEGLGYWLLYHHRKMEKDQFYLYLKKLRKKFNDYDVSYGLKKYNVNLIARKNPLKIIPENFILIQKNGLYLYLLNG